MHYISEQEGSGFDVSKDAVECSGGSDCIDDVPEYIPDSPRNHTIPGRIFYIWSVMIISCNLSDTLDKDQFFIDFRH